ESGTAARLLDCLDDRLVARPQDHPTPRPCQHGPERGAERAGADDADGIRSLAHWAPLTAASRPPAGPPLVLITSRNAWLDEVFAALTGWPPEECERYGSDSSRGASRPGPGASRSCARQSDACDRSRGRADRSRACRSTLAWYAADVLHRMPGS